MSDIKEYKRLFKSNFNVIEYGKPDCIELEVSNKEVIEGMSLESEPKTVQFRFDKQSGMCLGFDYEN